ncbi:hypothetical protein ACFQH2_04460 [Natronoarchaeum sp. GCM10025703]|uniref:hypothetical protein n=1 Tax=Natronoarchaeum sp. GCM10025703 TaxID=3252685 RepID=UPI00360C9BA0
MAPSTPFVDPQTSELDTTQIITESILLAKLIGFFVAIALVPFLVAILQAVRVGSDCCSFWRVSSFSQSAPVSF